MKIIIDSLIKKYKTNQNFVNKYFILYHKKNCPDGHKTITKYLGFRKRRCTWCPICQPLNEN